MTLSEFRDLFAGTGFLTGTAGTLPEQCPVSALSCNSAAVAPGTLFFCKGVRFRPEYLLDAAAKGACAYVSEVQYDVSLPGLIVSDVRKVMPLAAHAFYNAPESRYPLVGITGTKGKTSCAYQLAAILDRAYGGRYGLISTNEAVSCGQKRPKSGTTPEALDLYALLNGFAEDGAKAAVMEVSSQGLQYNRVDGLRFAVGIYLNLSPDHISPTEHRDFEEYKGAKKRLMTLCDCAVVNQDDPYADEMIAAAKNIPVRTVSLTDPRADYYAYDIDMTEEGLSFTVGGTDLKNRRFTLKMAGEFNISNALCAIAAARRLGVDVETIRSGLAAAQVAGRMERLDLNGVRVIVDYAHNGLSFEKVFDFADRFYPEARKIAVYGCPGNKAYDRRDEMSDVAGRRADVIVLTDDDPAWEDPDEIMDQAEKRLKFYGADYCRIHDRREAIAYALSLCRPGDLLLLLAKGHETGQSVQGKQVEYGGDRRAVLDAFAAQIARI